MLNQNDTINVYKGKVLRENGKEQELKFTIPAFSRKMARKVAMKKAMKISRDKIKLLTFRRVV